jgi:hypothetical protein
MAVCACAADAAAHSTAPSAATRSRTYIHSPRFGQRAGAPTQFTDLKKLDGSGEERTRDVKDLAWLWRGEVGFDD